MKRSGWAMVALATLSGACDSRPARDEGTATDAAASLRKEEAVQRGVAPGFAGAPPPAAAPEGARTDVVSSAQDPQAAPMLIRSASVSIEVDSLERAIAQVRDLAARVTGIVASTSIATGRDQVKSATLEVRVPSTRYDDAIRGMSAIGRVEAVNESAQDVGEEFVDLTARMANARRLEQRLVDLLARRTGKLEDVLAVERELSRVREEIERYEGRLRYLRTRVATSMITVTVHEPSPILSAAGRGPIAEAFRSAWRNFVGFIAALIASMGVVIPLAILLVGGVLVARRVLPPRKS